MPRPPPGSRDVSVGGEQVLLRLDGDGRVAAAEHVVLAPVAPVERLRVPAVHAVHGVRKSLDTVAVTEQEVVVRAHQAVGAQPQPKALDRPPEEPEKREAVAIVVEDLPPVVPTRRDVVRERGVEDAKRPCHSSTVGPPSRLPLQEFQYRHTFAPLLWPCLAPLRGAAPEAGTRITTRAGDRFLRSWHRTARLLSRCLAPERRACQRVVPRPAGEPD